MFSGQRVKLHWESGIAAYKIGEYALGLSNNLDLGEALKDFFPQYPQLHFTEAVTHTAVNTEAEGKVIARIGTINSKFIGPVNGRLIVIA